MKSLKANIRRQIYTTLGGVDKIFGRENNFVIYCYHNIYPNRWVFNVNEENFQKQIDYLCKWGQPVSLSQVYEYLSNESKLPKKSFAITFDDGYKGVAKTSTYLKQKGVKPTVFVLPEANKVDRKSIATETSFLSKSDIKKLMSLGWEVGSHGITHQKLDRLNPLHAKDEIVKSKEKIEKNLDTKVNYFSYPHGSFNKALGLMVKDAGYKMATSMDDRMLKKGTNIFAVPRVGVMGNHSMAEFEVLGSPSVISFRNFVKKTPLKRFI